MLESIFWIDFKTNLSNAYFDDEADDDAFCDWVNSQLNGQQFIYDGMMFDSPIPEVSTLAAVVDEFTSDHKLSVSISINSDADMEVAENSEELYKFIDTVIAQQFLGAFNEQCSVSFPSTREGTFHWLKFDGENFFSKIYHSESSQNYGTVAITQNSLYLIPDYEIVS